MVSCHLLAVDGFEGTLSDVLEVDASIPVETKRLARGRDSWRQDQLPSGQPFAGCLGFWRWSTWWQLFQSVVQRFVQGEERSCDAEVRDVPAGKRVGQRQPMTELRVVSGTYRLNPCRFLR